MSDTDSDAAKGAGREPNGSWVPPSGSAGTPPPPPPGHWSPPPGEPGQPPPPGYWSFPQGQPGQPGYWSPPQGQPPQGQPPQPGEPTYPPPPPPGYWPPPPPGAPGQPPPGYWPPAAQATVPPARPRSRALIALIAAGAVVVAGLGVGWGYATQRFIHSITAGSPLAQSPIRLVPQTGGSTNGSSGSSSNGSSSNLPAQSGQAGQPVDVQSVTSKVTPGIVDINTIVAGANGRNSEAAGTGMILTPDGEVLTNNHVVQQSTSIKVTIAGRSGSFNASVIGVDPSADVALVKIQGVSGLPTVQLADSSTLSVGQQVVAMGNAGGQGGAPSVTQGSITALDQTITASNDNGSSEQLNGLIQSDATIQPGDSGGALANAAGQVVGMITAGQTSGFRQSSTDVGYAIPASAAANVIDDIRAGRASSTVFIGPTGHLGIGVQDLDPITASRLGLNISSGALVTTIQSGSPAEQIGMTTNSVITSIDGTQINSASDLTPAIQAHKPGDKIKVTWVDTSGASHTATATLTTGPVA